MNAEFAKGYAGNVNARAEKAEAERDALARRYQTAAERAQEQTERAERAEELFRDADIRLDEQRKMTARAEAQLEWLRGAKERAEAELEDYRTMPCEECLTYAPGPEFAHLKAEKDRYMDALARVREGFDCPRPDTAPRECPCCMAAEERIRAALEPETRHGQ